MLLNVRNCNVNVNDNCPETNNNNEINNIKSLMNAFQIPIGKAPILPNL